MESSRRSQRAAFIAFAVVVVVALPLLLYFGRERWFRYDEWSFLASREANLHDLFAAHSVHWVTLPILGYRALWAAFGLHSYVPYQAMSVVSHLAVAVLVRAVMRRAGVRPWTATAAASLLVVFGAGEENILWAFQITFTAALAFGLVHLILADHDGPLDRRDWLGLLAGLAGLMCSGVAVTMVIVVGIAALARRGWRIAAFHTAPLGVAYGVWYLAIGRDAYENQSTSSPGAMLGFVRTAIAVAFDGMAQVPGLGWALGGLLVGGCFLAWRGLPPVVMCRVAAAPAALLIGAFIFLAITGFGRGPEIVRASRFTYVVAALSLPAIAVAADAIMRRWRVAAPILVLALGVALVGNIRLFDNGAQRRAGAFQRVYREQFLLLPRLPIAEQIPRDLRPDLGLAPWVSFGWMEDGVASGRFPAPGAVDPVEAATQELRLALRQQLRHRPSQCEPVAAPARVRLEAGSSLGMRSPVSVVYTNAEGTRSRPVAYAPMPGQRYLVAYAGPLDLVVRSVGGVFELCDPAGGAFVVPGGP